jgi:hypothetical protein
MRTTATFRSIRAAFVVTSVLATASVGLMACYDEDVPPPAHTGSSTVVVQKPGVTATQPAQTPVVNNIVEPAQPAPQPATVVTTPAPAPATTVNVQPRTVTVP